MWETSNGERILDDTEAVVFRIGLGLLFDFISDNADYAVGIPAFDCLSVPEKLAALEQVASGLLDASVPKVELTAVAEAAIGAVYALVSVDLELDISEDIPVTREAVRNALRTVEDAEIPDINCVDMEVWSESVELLLDQIVWDRDWEQSLIKPDEPPDVANQTRADYGISENYYAAVPADPNDRQLEKIKANLKRLCA